MGCNEICEGVASSSPSWEYSLRGEDDDEGLQRSPVAPRRALQLATPLRDVSIPGNSRQQKQQQSHFQACITNLQCKFRWPCFFGLDCGRAPSLYFPRCTKEWGAFKSGAGAPTLTFFSPSPTPRQMGHLKQHDGAGFKGLEKEPCRDSANEKGRRRESEK